MSFFHGRSRHVLFDRHLMDMVYSYLWPGSRSNLWEDICNKIAPRYYPEYNPSDLLKIVTVNNLRWVGQTFCCSIQQAFDGDDYLFKNHLTYELVRNKMHFHQFLLLVWDERGLTFRITKVKDTVQYRLLYLDDASILPSRSTYILLANMYDRPVKKQCSFLSLVSIWRSQHLQLEDFRTVSIFSNNYPFPLISSFECDRNMFQLYYNAKRDELFGIPSDNKKEVVQICFQTGQTKHVLFRKKVTPLFFVGSCILYQQGNQVVVCSWKESAIVEDKAVRDNLISGSTQLHYGNLEQSAYAEHSNSSNLSKYDANCLVGDCKLECWGKIKLPSAQPVVICDDTGDILTTDEAMTKILVIPCPAIKSLIYCH